MSTTGNEFEQPGVNYPDREDAEGAQTTPATGEPTRDEGVQAPPTMGEPAADASPTASEPSAEVEPGAEPTATATHQPGTEPSHEAVGIGVIDDGSHHGQDAGRETMTAGQAQHESGGLGPEQEQRLPAMSQNNASDLEKVAGIMAQTRSDVATMPFERVVEVLRERLTQAGVELPDRDVRELARQISTGDAESPAEADSAAPVPPDTSP
jgi:hypothetical protein